MINGLGPLASFLSSFTWVTGASAYTALAKRHAPAKINFNRALIATLLFAITCLIRFDVVSASWQAAGTNWPRPVMWLLISIFASYAVGDVLFMRAALLIGFPAAQAIGAIFPLWAALAAFFVRGETLSTGRITGVLTAIVGIVIVIVSRVDRNNQEQHKTVGRGALLALLCSMFWGINSFGAAEGGGVFDPALGNVIRMSMAAVLCGIMYRFLATPQERSSGPLLPKEDWRRYGLLIAAESFLGSMAYVYGMSHSEVAVGATLSSLAPILSLPLAWALKWERFQWWPLVGAFVTVAGVYLLM